MSSIRRKEALDYHSRGRRGKVEVIPSKPYSSQRDLSLAYSPGVAEPCLDISKNRDDVYRYTAKGNLVAVISNGTAVLGLGDFGPEASKPVMEGKGVLFKVFADPIVSTSKSMRQTWTPSSRPSRPSPRRSGASTSRTSRRRKPLRLSAGSRRSSTSRSCTMTSMGRPSSVAPPFSTRWSSPARRRRTSSSCQWCWSLGHGMPRPVHAARVGWRTSPF